MTLSTFGANREYSAIIGKKKIEIDSDKVYKIRTIAYVLVYAGINSSFSISRSFRCGILLRSSVNCIVKVKG